MQQPQSKTKLARALVDSLRAKDIKKSLAIAQQLNRSYPDYARGWYLGSCALRHVNQQHAVIAIDRALELEGSNNTYLVHKASCLMEAGRPERAREILSSLVKGGMLTAVTYFEIGLVYCALNQYEDAVEVFRRAINLEKNQPHYHYNLAVAYRFLGRLTESEEQLDCVLGLDSGDYEAHHLRSGLRRQTGESNHIAELKSALGAKNLRPVARVHLCFSLAKEFEDIGDAKASFAYLEQGARTRRENMSYDVQSDLDIIKEIQRQYSGDVFAGSIPGTHKAGPIFVLGMPRTGTTLVERILASHSSVISLGEPDNFSREMIRKVKDRGLRPRSRLDLISKTRGLDFAALGEAYIDSVESMRDGSSFFVDKLPFNYLYIGLIHLAIPNARIINVQRHPMASCYAVYKQLFQDAYPFSYDQKELAQYYVAYHRLMEHWNSVLPGVIHTVFYEDVIANTEVQARKLLEFCKLSWEPGCLRFYENRQASTTASAAQVREPVHNRSVDQWRQYRSDLQPVETILKEAGINIE